DQHQLERDLHLLTRMQGEEVDTALEREDPATQQSARIRALIAEVVEQKDAAVGLHVKRRLIVTARRAVRQLELVDGELAAGDDEGTANPNPTTIDSARFRRRQRIGARLVTLRIEHSNHVGVERQAMRDP